MVAISDKKNEPDNEKEKKSQLDIALSCYPTSKSQSYFLIEQYAKTKGIDPLDFILLHNDLKKKGRVVNVKGEDWVQAEG